MNLLDSTGELESGGRPVCLAIGMFDGVHLGHQQVMGKAVEEAAQIGGMAVVITFDRHPNEIVAPAHVPELIYPLSKKLSVIASLGPEAACLLHFDAEFSRISGEDFIRSLPRPNRPIQSISVGSSFVFGWRRSGDVALLRKLENELGYRTRPLEEVSLEGQPISSTRARQAIREGKLALAGRMLGRDYALCGQVVKGNGVGRQLGVPTANLDVAGLVTPPPGVYAARAAVRGETHLAAVNLGWRPTLADSAPKFQAEAHLLDFTGDLYGAEMELTFVSKIRDEQKFPNLAALQERILTDIALARQAGQS